MTDFPLDIELGKSGIRRFSSKDEYDGFLINEQRRFSSIFSLLPDGFLNVNMSPGQHLNQIRSDILPLDIYLTLLMENFIFSTESKYWGLAISRGLENIDHFAGFLTAYQGANAPRIAFNRTVIPISPDYFLGLGLGQKTFLDEKDAQQNIRIAGSASIILEDIQEKSSFVMARLAEMENFYTNLELKKRNYDEELEALHSTQTLAFASEWSKLNDKISALEISSSDSIERLNKSLSEDALISTTSNYWNQKVIRHNSRRNILTTICVIYAICLVPLIIVASVCLPLIFTGRQDYYIIFVFGVLITIAFWAVRILTRTLLNEQYLAGVSEERKVFVDTYLALIREGGATETERALMLATIFKSAPAGESKDDGATEASLVAFASKILAPRPNIP